MCCAVTLPFRQLCVRLSHGCLHNYLIHRCLLLLPDCDVVATFGRGEDGQLGHGACNEVEAPKAVKSLIDKKVNSVACGAEYTLAVSEGNLYSWGVSVLCVQSGIDGCLVRKHQLVQKCTLCLLR